MEEDPKDALESVEGAALTTEVVQMLESELVRFRHRVMHDYGIELDRARAAMVLLGRLVAAGVPWTARPDSDPARIHEAFSGMLSKHPALAPILKREIAGFFVATANVKVDEDIARTPSALLRRAGSEPSLWWWAIDYPDPTRCWAACESDVDKLTQVALAFGVPTDRVAAALASAFGVVASRLKTRFTAQRTSLTVSLAQLANGATALGDPTLVASITKLAFEMRVQQLLPKDQKSAPDPVADLAIHSFQLVEALQAATKQPDLERFSAVASRSERMFSSRGLQLASMLRKDLDPHVADAITRL